MRWYRHTNQASSVEVASAAGSGDIHATSHESGDSYTDQNELVGAEEEVHRQVPDGTIQRGSLEHAYTLGTVRTGTEEEATLFLLCSFSSTLCGRTLPLVRFSF